MFVGFWVGLVFLLVGWFGLCLASWFGLIWGLLCLFVGFFYVVFLCMCMVGVCVCVWCLFLNLCLGFFSFPLPGSDLVPTLAAKLIKELGSS